MNSQDNEVLEAICRNYEKLSHVEKLIGDYFLKKPSDVASACVTRLLHVSDASLTRFAQRCGYRGYRELTYRYLHGDMQLQQVFHFSDLTQQVLMTYRILLAQTFELIDEDKLARLSRLLTTSSRVFVYGRGSSGIAAQEFKLRFMRLGLSVEAIDNPHLMHMNSALVGPGMLIIGLSMSAKSTDVMKAMKLGKSRGAHVILMTANRRDSFAQYAHEIIHVASTPLLDDGISISPQFPLLLMMDLFFSKYLHIDYQEKTELHQKTVLALEEADEREENSI